MAIRQSLPVTGLTRLIESAERELRTYRKRGYRGVYGRAWLKACITFRIKANKETADISSSLFGTIKKLRCCYTEISADDLRGTAFR